MVQESSQQGVGADALGPSQDSGVELPKANNADRLIEQITARIQEIRSYTPKVGVFGNSGVGKSSLCNALFGQDMAKVHDVEACTREPQYITVGGGESSAGGIKLVDVPGIGEDPERHEEYVALYKSLVPKLDLVLWLIKADDRNYASAIDGYDEVFSTDRRELLTESDSQNVAPVIFVITQTDKTNDIDDWDRDNYAPGESQIGNIAIKENDVSKRFNVPAGNVISVAVSKKGRTYNLSALVDLVVARLPNEKKYPFRRETNQAHVTEETERAAEWGIWQAVKDLAGDAWDAVKVPVAEVIIASAPRALRAVGRLLRRWF